MVDRSSLNHYSTASSKAVDLAKRDLQRFWRRLDLTDPDKARNALINFIPTLVSTYGDLVATAAMEWYDEERAKVKGLPPYEATSDVYPTIDAQATASTRYAASHLYTNNPHQALAVLEGTVHRLIKDAGRDVIARNVKLDPAHPRYARVPRGAKTCAWCSILASRGWVYVSKESANLHGKGHDHCDCELVPSWKAHDEYIKGYDPDAEYARYEEARHAVAVEGGDPNDLKAIAAKARSLYPEAYTDGSGVRRSGKRYLKSQKSDLPVGAWPSGKPEAKGGVRPFESLAKTPRIKGETSFAEQVGLVNPNFGKSAQWPEIWNHPLPYNVNCVRAANTLILRCLGYDVRAGAGTYLPADSEIQNAAHALSMWKRDGKPLQFLAWMGQSGPSNQETLRGMNRTSPEGAFGVVQGAWQEGGAHIWCWEKRGKKILFWDGQTGQKVATSTYMKRLKRGTMRFARLDDASPSDELLNVISIDEPDRKEQR